MNSNRYKSLLSLSETTSTVAVSPRPANAGLLSNRDKVCQQPMDGHGFPPGAARFHPTVNIVEYSINVINISYTIVCVV